MSEKNNYPQWFDGKKINEILFCESFRKEHPMICVNGKFFTVDGAIEDEQELAREIFDAIKFFVTEKVSATVKSLIARFWKISVKRKSYSCAKRKMESNVDCKYSDQRGVSW